VNRQLDPWDDASELATRLQQDNSCLYVVIAAEAWCARCRDLRPEFEEVAALRHADEIWLWLDLEEHAEFVGDFLPDTLPVLLAYHGSHFCAVEAIDGAASSLRGYLDAIKTPLSAGASVRDPGIRTRLITSDWALSA